MELNPYLLFEDLMDALPSHPESVGYPLRSPTFLPQPGDGCALSEIDLRVNMGMFEEELTPVAPANNIPKKSREGNPPTCFIWPGRRSCT